MRKASNLLLFIFVFAVCFVNTLQKQDVFASSEYKIADEKIIPSSGSLKYGYKRLKEKFFLLIYQISPPKKLNYMSRLTDIRLSELILVFERDDKANIETATQRYFTTVGNLVEYLLNENFSLEEKKPVKNNLSNHKEIVNTLLPKYDPGSAEGLLVKQASDYLNIYINKL